MMANGENSIVMGYVYNSEGKPEAVGAMMPPQLPGKVSALEGRVDALETSGGTGSGPALSDAVDSTSSTTAASSMAVKTAYDKALEAQASAEAADGKADTAQASAETATSVAQSAKTSAETAQAAADDAMQQALLGGSGGGAAVISLTEDKAMTATDQRNLLVSADMPGRSIMLPDASTIEADGIAFRILVQGDYDVTVKDAQGRPVGANSGKVAVGGTRMFLLMDKASGLWRWADWQNGESGGSGAGSTVVPGVGYVFNSYSTTSPVNPRIATLTQNSAILAFSDAGNSRYGTACFITVSGTEIEIGEKVVFYRNNTDSIRMVALSSSKALVTFRHSASPYEIGACILDVSGKGINVGTVKIFTSFDATDIPIARLSEVKAIAVFRDTDNSGYGTACILNISGDTITVGGTKVFNSASISNISIASLTEEKAVVSFSNAGNFNYGTACIFNISGDTITVGDFHAFSDGNVDGLKMDKLNESTLIVVYLSPDKIGIAKTLSVYQDSVDSGTGSRLSESNIADIFVASLASNKAIAAYKDVGNSGYGTACVLDIA